VPIGAPLSQQDAEYLRDLIHAAGFPARAEQMDVDHLEIINGQSWLVWTPAEHEKQALSIRERHFDGPTRRPRRRSRLTGLFRKGPRAA